MEPLRELPMGFGMALFENDKAAQHFSNMTAVERQAVLQQVREVGSKNEMRALVQRIGDDADE
ncbi:MAG: hypothetical protein PHU79_02125 [Oscillospiraceae bacterium]|nr:hypothetical protein [Oscillospiraceae bacterium]